MNKFIRLVSAFALLSCGVSVSSAADDGWLTCKDGLMARSAAVCDVHGGVRIEPAKSVPIDASKGFATKSMATTKATTATKPKTQQAKTSSKTKNKTAAKSTRNPTAKCLDGAYYFSTERRGACAKHGGVDTWYGW